MLLYVINVKGKDMQKKNKLTKKLSNKPHVVIRDAIKDLEKCEKDKNYLIDMSCFHIRGRKCEVCWAGSVMAKSLNVPINQNYFPSNFNNSTADKLYALDDFRIGNWDWALEGFRVKKSKIKEIFNIINDHIGKKYNLFSIGSFGDKLSHMSQTNRKKWKKIMLDVADIIEKELGGKTK